jgi:hypothetical protein
MATACKSKKPTDDFVHVDVYGQMNSRYEPILESRFRSFSRERAKLPTGRKILVSEVMEANFYDRLADPAYRGQAQVIVLNSEQEAAVDPNLATEFVTPVRPAASRFRATCSSPIASAESNATQLSNCWITWHP